MANEFEGVSWPGWEVVRKIGEGSFGGVYEIRRTLPDGRVEACALKKLTVPKNTDEIDELYAQSFDKDSITAYFRNQMSELVSEYSLMRSLNSCPNVVSCHDIRYVQHQDNIGWDIYIRMELLRPLKRALGGSCSEETVVDLGTQLCNALTACHAENIIHRDIKPENIMVSDKGIFKLGDFGVAKVSERTGTGTLTGTYGYMAPEVANHQHYGAGADIYSLGMVLYWMMNRRTLPFLPLPPGIPTGVQRQQAQERRLSGEPLPPPVDGSEALKKIVLKACAFSPAERYRSAEEMSKALQRCVRASAAQEQSVPERKPVPITPPAPILEPTVIDTPTELECEPSVHANDPKQRQQVPVQQGRQRMAEKQTPEKEAPKKDAPKKKQKKPVIYRVMVSLIAAALILACCGIGIMVYHYAGHFSNEPQTESGTVPAPHEEDDRVITVAASPTPHAEILKAAAKVLEKDGWTLDVKEYSDYVVPNNVVEDGEIDANYFQHQPYLDTFNAENGTHLVSVAQVHYEPFGIYAGTKSSIADLEDGDEIAIPNDGSNRARALLLLEANGIITLKEGVGMQATSLDIVNKSVAVGIVEMEAAQVPKVRDSVALAVINGNYALQAGLNVEKDAIASEDPDSVSAQTYANVLVVKEGNENSEKIQALKKALLSDDVRTHISETYSGSVVPLGGSADSAPVSASLRVLRNDETYSEDDAILGQEVLRKEVATITFLSTLDSAPADAWDLSEAESGGVLGWVTGTKGNYDLYIAANGSVVAPRYSDYLFAYYTNLREINFNGCFDTSLATTMSAMFAGCTSLQHLDLSSFDASHTVAMDSMFSDCQNLKSLDFGSGFDTSYSLDMRYMFSWCISLESLDLSGFDTSFVTAMSGMFSNCENLHSLDLSGFDTSQVTDMAWMFEGCASLQELDLGSFNTSNVINMQGMFNSCGNLTALNLGSFDTSRVMDMSAMFIGCEGLTSLDLSSFDTSHVMTMECMFAFCTSLVDIDLSNFDFAGVIYYDDFMDEGKTCSGKPWEELFAVTAPTQKQ